MNKSILKLSLLVVFSSLIAVGWFNKYWLYDSYRIAFYHPTAEVSDYVQGSGMSPEAERLFIAAQPLVLDNEPFNNHCKFADLGLVLGCYKGTDIFILNVTDPKLVSVETVTAAHEMLHVVYSRLTQSEKNSLDALLDEQYMNVDNKRIIDEIEGYKKDPKSDIHNEMHSIFGTELANLSSPLEEHYSRYFTDRSKVLASSSKYEKVFNELEDQIAGFDKQLSILSQQINSYETQITTLANQITSQRAQLNVYENNNQIAEYNALVPQFNDLVNQHNTRVELYKQVIDKYNSIVVKRNKVGVAKNDLIKSLDSSLEAI